MRVGIIRCKHCQDEYQFQFSGSYKVEGGSPSADYCITCYSAIDDALSKIPRKRFRVVKDINQVAHLFKRKIDLDTLLRWENEKEEEDRQYNKLPVARQVFASLYSTEKKEHQRVNKVIGREDCQGAIFMYRYWPSDPSDFSITVEIEEDADGNILGHWEPKYSKWR